MFKRKAYSRLLEWKKEWAGSYAALLQGARRVGKSTIVEEFAKNEYRSYILIDFSKVRKDVLALFEDISDLDLFFTKLQSFMGKTLYRRESVVVFDEVQLAPLARQAIKHLVKDGRYDYIETGSLISIKKNVKNIVIPSEEIKIDMFPMDYEEFLWATKEDGAGTFENLKAMAASNKKLGDAVNRKLMADFRLYMAVGGMPQAVEAFVQKKNFQQIDFIKKKILELYMDDFRKIDASGRVSMIFNAVPSQLAMKRKHFMLSQAVGKKRTTKDEELLSDLIDSKTVMICHNVNDPGISLAQTKSLDTYKLYLADTGLFTTMLFNDGTETNKDIYNKLLADKLPANLGYLYENAVAQAIKAMGKDLYYHTWQKDNSTHSYEVDFLIQDRAKLIAVEVKSSAAKNHESIDAFSQKYGRHISRRILFSQQDTDNDKDLELKPVYMTSVFLN